MYTHQPRPIPPFGHNCSAVWPDATRWNHTLSTVTMESVTTMSMITIGSESGIGQATTLLIDGEGAM